MTSPIPLHPDTEHTVAHMSKAEQRRFLLDRGWRRLPEGRGGRETWVDPYGYFPIPWLEGAILIAVSRKLAVGTGVYLAIAPQDEGVPHCECEACLERESHLSLEERRQLWEEVMHQAAEQPCDDPNCAFHSSGRLR